MCFAQPDSAWDVGNDERRKQHDTREQPGAWGLVVFLIVGLLIIDAAVLKVKHAEPPFSSVSPTRLLGGLMLSQVAMLSLWAVLGGTPAPVRLFGLILGVVLWASPLAWLIDPSLNGDPDMSQ